jgi:1,4-alpha-glucan branching enzyme
MDKPKATSTRQLKEGGRIKKQCLKSRPVCKVTFKLPKEASSGAQQVCVVGDFNNWSKEAHLMNRLKNGTFTLTLELEKGSGSVTPFFTTHSRCIEYEKDDFLHFCF